MPVTIGYDSESRMILSGLSCACGCRHSLPTQDIYVGRGLIERVPRMIEKRGLGRRAMLITDDNTRRVAGERVYRALLDAGFQVELCHISRQPQAEPDELSVGQALLTMQADTECLISVGSGTLTDVARIVATRTGKPFVAVGTAPSMDGYTSVVAPLLLKGAKIHRQGLCPEIIVCDLDVLATAPVPMFIAGVGDVLGKYIAKADWVLGNIILDEPYCPACGGIVLSAIEKLLANVEHIQNRTPEGTRVLIEALLLAGITIMIVGHTRAVASAEHNIAHYWEMRKLAAHEKPPAHGTSVGVATLMIWPLFERFARESARRIHAIDPAARAAAIPQKEARRAFMREMYGEDAAEAIMRENPGDFLTPEEMERRVRRAKERFDDIRAELSTLPPYATIRRAMERLGAPLNAGEIGISPSLCDMSLRCAKDYRTRYTLLKTLDELGLLDEYLRDM